jgi:hypothetical protein
MHDRQVISGVPPDSVGSLTSKYILTQQPAHHLFATFVNGKLQAVKPIKKFGSQARSMLVEHLGDLQMTPTDRHTSATCHAALLISSTGTFSISNHSTTASSAFVGSNM